MSQINTLLFILATLLIPFKTMAESQVSLDSLNIPIGFEKVDRNNALAFDYKPTDLVQIDQKWNYHGADYKKFVRKEVKLALIEMLEAAELQNLKLKIVSAYRSYKKQEYLYNRAVKKHGLNQNTTAQPGYSEHQLGTAVDVGTIDPSSILEQSFGETKASQWLQLNASKYGFYQSYTKENSHNTGYIPEPWHYRFLGLLNF